MEVWFKFRRELKMDISTPKERDQLWNQAPQGLTHFKAKSLLPWSTEPRFWMCATPTWVFHTQKGLSLWFLRCLWSHVSCSSVLFGSSFFCVSYLHCSCYYLCRWHTSSLLFVSTTWNHYMHLWMEYYHRTYEYEKLHLFIQTSMPDTRLAGRRINIKLL